MPSRTIASWRLGHDPDPLKHCAARAFHAPSPAAAQPDVRRSSPAAGRARRRRCRGRRVSTRAARRADEAGPAVEGGSSSVWVSRSGPSVDVAPGSWSSSSRPAAWWSSSADVGGPGGRSVVVGPSFGCGGGDVVVGARRGVRSPAGNVGVAGRRSVARRRGRRRCGAVVEAWRTSSWRQRPWSWSPPARWSRSPTGPRADALDHRPQRDDAGDVGGVERLALVAHAREVDDDVLAFDAHVGLGDAAVLQLGPDEVTDDDQVVVAGPLGRAPGRRTSRPAGRGRAPACCRRSGWRRRTMTATPTQAISDAHSRRRHHSAASRAGVSVEVASVVVVSVAVSAAPGTWPDRGRLRFAAEPLVSTLPWMAAR